MAFNLLTTDPPVLLLQDWNFRIAKTTGRWLFEAVRWRRPHLLIGLSWSYRKPTAARRLKRKLRRWGISTRRVTVLANEKEEIASFASVGLSAIHCNHNAFLSERIYRPIAMQKEIDAVYDAALSPFKRHELARDIENLALITYVKSDEEMDVAKQIRLAVPQAVVLNEPFRGVEGMFTPSEVNHALNRARVGLCLSAEEGAMFASAQYLLAGVPVVTTRNVGGRDDFFDSKFVRWVEDDPAAVAEGVRELIAVSPDPSKIQACTMELIRPHRERFCSLIAELTEGTGTPWVNGWPRDAPNKLHSENNPDLRSLLNLAFVGKNLIT